MEKIAISGGPHTGKTTLHGAMKEVFPDIHYIEEPASVVMKKAKGDGVYWTEVFGSAERFCEECIEEAVSSEAAIPANARRVVFDRTLVDTIAYARRDGCEAVAALATALAHQAMYSKVLFCDFVGDYAGRIETREEAENTHSMLREAYRELDIPIIDIPAVSVGQRVTLVKSVLAESVSLKV